MKQHHRKHFLICLFCNHDYVLEEINSYARETVYIYICKKCGKIFHDIQLG